VGVNNETLKIFMLLPSHSSLQYLKKQNFDHNYYKSHPSHLKSNHT